jgi:hypothetical protein
MAGRALPRVTRRGGLGRGLWPEHKGVITHDDATATYRLTDRGKGLGGALKALVSGSFPTWSGSRSATRTRPGPAPDLQCSYGAPPARWQAINVIRAVSAPATRRQALHFAPREGCLDGWVQGGEFLRRGTLQLPLVHASHAELDADLLPGHALSGGRCPWLW